MADIRITTQVEGIQQALTDIQNLRAQLESLGQVSAQAAAGLQSQGQQGGGGGGGGGGGQAGAGGGGGGQAGAGGTTTVTPGGSPTPAPPGNLAQMADDAQEQQRIRGLQAAAMGMGNLSAFLPGFGELSSGLQQIANILQATHQLHVNNSGGGGGTPPAANASGQTAGSQPNPPTAPPATGFQDRFAMGALRYASIAATTATAVAGAASQYIGMELEREEVLLAPQRQYMASFGNRAALNFGFTRNEEMQAEVNLAAERRIANIEAGRLTIGGFVASNLFGRAYDALEQQRINAVREQQAEAQVRAEAEAQRIELRASGLSVADPFREQSFRASQALGFGVTDVSDVLTGLRGRTAVGGGRLDTATASQTIASLAEQAFYDPRLGGPNRTPESTLLAAARNAIASGDMQQASQLSKLYADQIGGMGNTSADAAIAQLQEQTIDANRRRADAEMGSAERTLRQSEINFLRQGGAGGGMENIGRIYGLYGQQANTYNAQIRQLEGQIALTSLSPRDQMAYRAQLNEVRNAQLQARAEQFGFEYGIEGMQERMVSAESRYQFTEALRFGSLGEQQQALLNTVEPARMEVGRLQTQMARLRSGEEPGGPEKLMQVSTQLTEAMERLANATVNAEKGVFSLGQGVAGAARALASTERQTGLMMGLGGIGTAGSFRQEMAATNTQAQMAEQELTYYRAQGYSEDSEQVRSAKQRVAETRQGQVATGLQFLQSGFSAAATERVEQGAFAIQAASILPGGFGIRREMMGQQLAGIGMERAELEQMFGELRAARGGELSAGEIQAYNRQQRNLSMQQIGLLGELSYGWQNRLLSTVSGAPDMSAISPLVSYRAAIGAGVRMPFFGSNQGDLENAIESSMMIGSIAGQQTPAGLAAQAFTRMPNTVGMRGSAANIFDGVVLQVDIPGIGTASGQFRPRTGGNVARDNGVDLVRQLAPQMNTS